MGSYILYKSKKEYVEHLNNIPEPVQNYLNDIGYVPDKKYVKDYLTGCVEENEMTLEDMNIIIKFLEDNDLYDYDVDLEYD